jgi:hypothetical protein
MKIHNLKEQQSKKNVRIKKRYFFFAAFFAAGFLAGAFFAAGFFAAAIRVPPPTVKGYNFGQSINK